MRATKRDYAAEMRTLIDKETSDGPYSSRKVAERIVEYLRAADPDLLDGWLHNQAGHFVWQAINNRDRSMRSRARSIIKPAEFARDSVAHDDGDDGRMVHWLAVPFVVRTGLRMKLGDMRQPDVLFVAKTYELRAEDNRMTAAFLKVVARKVGNRTVGEVYTDERLSAAWRSIAGDSQ